MGIFVLRNVLEIYPFLPPNIVLGIFEKLTKNKQFIGVFKNI